MLYWIYCEYMLAFQGFKYAKHAEGTDVQNGMTILLMFQYKICCQL